MDNVSEVTAGAAMRSQFKNPSQTMLRCGVNLVET